MLIGRREEKTILLNSLQEEESQFIALYGRRRIGKTYLVRQTFDNDFAFQHSGVAKGNKHEQIMAFCASLKRYGLNKEFEIPNTWLETFELLKDLIELNRAKKKVIFLDELSWMDTIRSDFMMALEWFWNGWASARKDVVLIVCASATSWMIKKIIHNKGGLYNRLNYKIHLSPFNLHECEELLISNGVSFDQKQIVEAYMILGGVPFYWSLMKKEYSVAQNIDYLFFKEDAILAEEYEHVFSASFTDSDEYQKIIASLATKKIGMNREEIIKTAKLKSNGSLTRWLEDLEKCDFIRSYKQYGNKSKGTTYQLMDNFTLFYYQFLKGKPDDANYWSHNLDSNLRNSWAGLAFERVCLQHIKQIKKKLGIEGISTYVCSWSCKANKEEGINGSQIDLLIVRRDRVINLCEIKYSNNEYAITKKTDEDFRNKISDFINVNKIKYSVHLTLITMYGLLNNEYSGKVQSTITSDDLFYD